MTPAVEVRQLGKHDGAGRGQPPLRAVDGIDFTVRAGVAPTRCLNAFA